MVLEDYVNALWRVITALDFYKFKLELLRCTVEDNDERMAPPFGGAVTAGD